VLPAGNRVVMVDSVLWRETFDFSKPPIPTLLLSHSSRNNEIDIYNVSVFAEGTVK
jgi:hypothetical protein